MGAAMRTLVLLLLHCGVCLPAAGSSTTPPPERSPVQCSVGGRFHCTVSNSYGAFNDRQPCRAAEAVFPSTEAELVAAVARAVQERRRVKVATSHSHGFPKLACPGGGGMGTVISTALLNRVVGVDDARKQMTVESGMVLRDLLDAVAAAGLALPNAPYFTGLSIGGIVATGAHGSSLWGKGGAAHEYVVGMRIVTPAPAHESYAMVRELRAGDPDLDAAKVSVGVLGVISQVTLQLEPQFKRKVTILLNHSDADLPELIATWGRSHEFADMYWLPGQGTVLLRQDDRVDVSTPGDGKRDAGLSRLRPASDLVRDRQQQDQLQAQGSDEAFCKASRTVATVSQQQGFGYTNDGATFTGYPVVGYQDRMQGSGSCLDGPEDGLNQSCAWNPRINGWFFYNPGMSVTISKSRAFISDLMRLRDCNPEAFCGLDLTTGFSFRYIKASSAYLGKAEDSVEFDLVYYRSREWGKPVMNADIIDEIEQITLYKYGGLPHWGKNRNYAFNDTVGRFPRLRKFLEVKARFDPDGVFSSRWSDHVLGIRGSPVTQGPGCAVEGLCTCTKDSHCAPGYVCSQGKVYPEARVCTVQPPAV